MAEQQAQVLRESRDGDIAVPITAGDHAEGRAAFLEKRAPRFAGR